MKGERIVCIYKITNPSGHIYIGQTRDFLKRKNFYRLEACKFQARIYRSIKKYGWENHLMEIVHECSEQFLNELEKFYIIFYDTFDTHHGLNLNLGGRHGGFPSEESRKKMSAWQIGRKMSPEACKKMSEARIGKKSYIRSEETKLKLRISAIKRNANKPHPRLGIPCSEETKKKIGDANRGNKSWLGKKHSEETKNKLSERHKGKVFHWPTPEQIAKRAATMKAKKKQLTLL